MFISKIKEEPEVNLPSGTYVSESEIWWASCSRGWRPAPLVKTRLEPAYKAFREPHLSPDSSRVYFLVDQWSATSGGLFYLERASGKITFFAPALGFWVIAKGFFRGDLVLEQAPLSLAEGRLDIFYLFAPNGKQIQIVGFNEDRVKAWLNEAENY